MHPDEFRPQGNSDWLETYNLNLKDVVLCDIEDCNLEAVAYFQMRCCNTVLIYCQGCLDSQLRFIIKMFKQKRRVSCSDCKQSMSAEGCITKPQPLKLQTA